jgi:hypothetical protein
VRAVWLEVAGPRRTVRQIRAISLTLDAGLDTLQFANALLFPIKNETENHGVGGSFRPWAHHLSLSNWFWLLLPHE